MGALIAEWKPVGEEVIEIYTEPQNVCCTLEPEITDLADLARRILWHITENPGSDSEDIARAFNITDKLASDLTADMARMGMLEFE